MPLFRAIEIQDEDEPDFHLILQPLANDRLMVIIEDSQIESNQTIVTVNPRAIFLAIKLLFEGRNLTCAGADAPGAPESSQDSPADAPLDSARGSA